MILDRLGQFSKNRWLGLALLAVVWSFLPNFVMFEYVDRIWSESYFYNFSLVGYCGSVVMLGVLLFACLDDRFYDVRWVKKALAGYFGVVLPLFLFCGGSWGQIWLEHHLFWFGSLGFVMNALVAVLIASVGLKPKSDYAIDSGVDLDSFDAIFIDQTSVLLGRAFAVNSLFAISLACLGLGVVLVNQVGIDLDDWVFHHNFLSGVFGLCWLVTLVFRMHLLRWPYLNLPFLGLGIVYSILYFVGLVLAPSQMRSSVLFEDSIWVRLIASSAFFVACFFLLPLAHKRAIKGVLLVSLGFGGLFLILGYYGIFVRIFEYALTPSRLALVVVLLLLSLWYVAALGKLIFNLKGVFKPTALLSVAILLILSLPALHLDKLSFNSQMKRAQRDKQISKEDLHFLNKIAPKATFADLDSLKTHLTAQGITIIDKPDETDETDQNDFNQFANNPKNLFCTPMPQDFFTLLKNSTYISISNLNNQNNEYSSRYNQTIWILTQKHLDTTLPSPQLILIRAEPTEWTDNIQDDTLYTLSIEKIWAFNTDKQNWQNYDQEEYFNKPRFLPQNITLKHSELTTDLCQRLTDQTSPYRILHLSPSATQKNSTPNKSKSIHQTNKE